MSISTEPTSDLTRWNRAGLNQVQYLDGNAATYLEDLRLALRQQFAAKSGDIDVLMIDVVWPGVIKDHLVDLKPYSKGVEKDHFPAIVANNTVDGKLLGMISIGDLVKDIISEQKFIIEQLEQYITGHR